MKAEIGTISHGTLRTEDLLESFVDELIRLDTEEKYTSLVWRVNEIIAKEDFDSDEASYIVNESLPDALNEFAPDGCYFGTTEGDGSDFGFWPINEDRA